MKFYKILGLKKFWVFWENKKGYIDGFNILLEPVTKLLKISYDLIAMFLYM